jgi:hypothetical protein
MPVIVKQEKWDDWFASGVLPADSFGRINTPPNLAHGTTCSISLKTASAVTRRCQNRPLMRGSRNFACFSVNSKIKRLSLASIQPQPEFSK